MPTVLYDTDNDVYIQDDSLLTYIRNNVVGGQEMSLTVQTYVNGDPTLNSYLNRKVFNKQKIDLSLRKFTFKKNDLRGDESGKKVFLTVLNEKIKKETAGTGMTIDEARLVTKSDEPNFYNNYQLVSNKQNNTCPIFAE